MSSQVHPGTHTDPINQATDADGGCRMGRKFILEVFSVEGYRILRPLKFSFVKVLFKWKKILFYSFQLQK